MRSPNAPKPARITAFQTTAVQINAGLVLVDVGQDRLLAG
jgi:hypothetical protein